MIFLSKKNRKDALAVLFLRVFSGKQGKIKAT